MSSPRAASSPGDISESALLVKGNTLGAPPARQSRGRAFILGMSRDAARTDRRWETRLPGGVSLRLVADDAPSDAETPGERVPQQVRIP